jgi:hypothetical protein
VVAARDARSFCCESSISVFSPRIAASATFALKLALWLRRGRFVMVSPVPGFYAAFRQKFHS